MGDRYSINSNLVCTSPASSILGLQGLTTVRARIYEANWGSIATPADTAVDWLLRRGDTALGSSTAQTPLPVDPSAPVALTPAADTYTVEPTYPAGETLFRIGLNQRASWRWVAAPESELLMSQVATESITLGGDHATAGDMVATIFFSE